MGTIIPDSYKIRCRKSGLPIERKFCQFCYEREGCSGSVTKEEFEELHKKNTDRQESQRVD